MAATTVPSTIKKRLTTRDHATIRLRPDGLGARAGWIR